MLKYRSSLILSHLTLIIPMLCPLIMCYQCQVFVIRSVFPLPYNIGSPYLIHTLIIDSTCQPGMYYLNLTSFSSSLKLLNLHQVFMIRSVSLLPYNLGSPYLVCTSMMESASPYFTLSFFFNFTQAFFL